MQKNITFFLSFFLLCSVPLLSSCHKKPAPTEVAPPKPVLQEGPDALVMKDGTIVYGKILKEEDDFILIQWGGGDVEFSRDEISQVQKDIGAVKDNTREVTDSLVLKNGGVIQGKIVEETARTVVFNWNGGDVEFGKDEISEIKYGKKLAQGEAGIEMPEFTEASGLRADEYPRIYTNKGEIAAGHKLRYEEDSFILAQEIEGGGMIEFSFPREDVEKIVPWAPLPDAQSSEGFSALMNDERKRFEKFKFYNRSPYYVFSDAEASDLVQYLKTLNKFFYRFLTEYYELLDLPEKMEPLHVVFFADQKLFLEYGGLPPGTNVLGFFDPESKVLCIYNIKQTEMYERYFRMMMAQQEAFDDFYARLKNSSSAMGTSLGRMAAASQEIINPELDKERGSLEYAARNATMEIIRHEGGHQLLFLYGIDSAKRYRGAWLSEGLATYMEPEAVGGVNKSRLQALRYSLESGTLMPLQYLLSFASGGGIHKLDSSYALLGYEQSWAFIYFLMEKYRMSFYAYLQELKKQGETFSAEADIKLLEKHAGKPLAALEEELEKFVRKITKAELDEEAYQEYRILRLMSNG